MALRVGGWVSQNPGRANLNPPPPPHCACFSVHGGFLGSQNSSVPVCVHACIFLCIAVRCPHFSVHLLLQAVQATKQSPKIKYHKTLTQDNILVHEGDSARVCVTVDPMDTSKVSLHVMPEPSALETQSVASRYILVFC